MKNQNIKLLFVSPKQDAKWGYSFQIRRNGVIIRKHMWILEVDKWEDSTSVRVTKAKARELYKSCVDWHKNGEIGKLWVETQDGDKWNRKSYAV